MTRRWKDKAESASAVADSASDDAGYLYVDHFTLSARDKPGDVVRWLWHRNYRVLACSSPYVPTEAMGVIFQPSHMLDPPQFACVGDTITDNGDGTLTVRVGW